MHFTQVTWEILANWSNILNRAREGRHSQLSLQIQRSNWAHRLTLAPSSTQFLHFGAFSSTIFLVVREEYLPKVSAREYAIECKNRGRAPIILHLRPDLPAFHSNATTPCDTETKKVTLYSAPEYLPCPRDPLTRSKKNEEWNKLRTVIFQFWSVGSTKREMASVGAENVGNLLLSNTVHSSLLCVSTGLCPEKRVALFWPASALCFYPQAQ